ncbi:GNAT family N-acetyltransferase [Streptomyces sp. MMBL 11-1]|uniref:GNAT family N-acetyltransferase n=1 Tax=Streptomyces sp. MMBL 11-1 TaxID=3026420 RepID=UPI00236005F8|nr:GNAT family N-acetyltransferase [Streptomyces sp. MMBL 11-1]
MTDLLPIAAPAWTIVTAVYDSPAARGLTDALYREQAAIYGTADDPAATPPHEFRPPHGRFLIATSPDGIPLACGGWRTASPGTAEIKRMYVSPAARGHGLGHQMLNALEEDARQHRMTKAILETGVDNRDALALYTRAGYARIQSYVTGRNPQINRALSKQLLKGAGGRGQLLDGRIAPCLVR